VAGSLFPTGEAALSPSEHGAISRASQSELPPLGTSSMDQMTERPVGTSSYGRLGSAINFGSVVKGTILWQKGGDNENKKSEKLHDTLYPAGTREYVHGYSQR